MKQSCRDGKKGIRTRRTSPGREQEDVRVWTNKLEGYDTNTEDVESLEQFRFLWKIAFVIEYRLIAFDTWTPGQKTHRNLIKIAPCEFFFKNFSKTWRKASYLSCIRGHWRLARNLLGSPISTSQAMSSSTHPTIIPPWIENCENYSVGWGGSLKRWYIQP